MKGNWSEKLIVQEVSPNKSLFGLIWVLRFIKGNLSKIISPNFEIGNKKAEYVCQHCYWGQNSLVRGFYESLNTWSSLKCSLGDLSNGVEEEVGWGSHFQNTGALLVTADLFRSSNWHK